MKKIRNGLVLALSLMVFLSGFTACSKKPDAFEHETFSKVANELDIDDFDIEDLSVGLSSFVNKSSSFKNPEFFCTLFSNSIHLFSP